MAQNTSRHHAYVCPYWIGGLIDNPLRRWLHDPRKIFAGLVSPGQTALDLGCGPGTFTFELSRRVGEKGHVFAVDLQPEMLRNVRNRVERSGLSEQITLNQSTPDRIGLDVQADFAMGFWMVHEVQNQADFLGEVYRLLKPGGHFLLVEPAMHVSAESFEQTCALAKQAGLQPVEERKIRISRAVLFQKTL
jgi:ubiquinone/menaquinone biosynthesis C-methylase UbiE